MSATVWPSRCLLPVVIGILLVVTACSGGVATTTGTTIAATSTLAPGGTDSLPTTTGAVTTTTTMTISTTAPTGTTQALPVFPPERLTAEHGGDAWVVVLAASEVFDDPVLAKAEGHARDAGYIAGATDCDVGAAAALGLRESDKHYFTVSVYLDSEADAHLALKAFQARGVEGVVAVVQTYCLD